MIQLNPFKPSFREPKVQHLLCELPSVRLCHFRCPPSHARWSREHVIDDGHNVVFPRAAVTITQADREPVVADPNQVVFYNNGVPYRRRLVTATGDTANVLLVDDSLLNDAITQYDVTALERSDGPFRFTNGPLEASTHVRQRQLFDYVENSDPVDELYVLETVVELLDSVFRSTFAARGCREAKPARSGGRLHRQMVEEVRRFIATRFCTKICLRDVAEGVGASMHHLCRVFRRETGTTLHRYVTALRLREAMEMMRDPTAPLAAIGLIVGFSSQSHFTFAFRREFGLSPNQFRWRMPIGS